MVRELTPLKSLSKPEIGMVTCVIGKRNYTQYARLRLFGTMSICDLINYTKCCYDDYGLFGTVINLPGDFDRLRQL